MKTLDPMTAKQGIFISYRHDDSLVAAGALYRELIDHHYNKELVFWDFGIQPGDNWLQTIEQKLDASKVLLAVVGPRWIDMAANWPAGERDFVRAELERARTKRIRVIPVRVAGARVPTRKELPRDLRWLVDDQVQWANLSEEHYRIDVGRLVEVIGGAEGTLRVSGGPEPAPGRLVLRNDGPYAVFVDEKLLGEFDPLKGEREVALRIPRGKHKLQAAIRPRTPEIMLGVSRVVGATSQPPRFSHGVRVEPTTHPQLVHEPEMTLYEPSEPIPFELKGGQEIRFDVSCDETLRPHRKRCVLKPPQPIVRP